MSDKIQRNNIYIKLVVIISILIINFIAFIVIFFDKSDYHPQKIYIPLKAIKSEIHEFYLYLDSSKEDLFLKDGYLVLDFTKNNVLHTKIKYIDKKLVEHNKYYFCDSNGSVIKKAYICFEKHMNSKNFKKSDIVLVESKEKSDNWKPRLVFYYSNVFL
jgi:hypothetical protein